MARTAVSTSSFGSIPARVTMLITVPDRSASTQPARCASPRYGSPGSRTQPEATSSTSGSDGLVSDGGCSTKSPGGWVVWN
jgi:hypothetical protein